MRAEPCSELVHRERRLGVLAEQGKAGDVEG